ncbi:glycosyltransferase, partial [Romboutsia timonensis]|uniref:glycosyltransferase n=1 Tax=Romboutsia timonensis TaxID=1776391 RepID=UPI00248B3EA6
LRKDIDTELIILDTGSTDSTVEIAKKYTDKVYFAKWNENFADMRNISISYAIGDWILILDADEELTNYDKLKDFFNCDKHKKYNCATIELKNIFNKKDKKYSLASIPRIFKNVDGFRYDGTIHEQPRYKEPIYNDIASFNHYGYMYSDEEIRQKKNERNIKLLLEEIQKNPNDPYINYQLGKSYISDLKNNEALYYIEKSYDLYNKQDKIPLFVIGNLLRLYVELKLYIKCENLCIKYIKNDKKNIDVYYYLATSQNNLGKYKESIKNYERYLYLLDNYNISTQANNMEAVLETGENKELVKSAIIELYDKLEMYDKIVRSLDDLSEEAIKNVYYIVFKALYKLNSEEKILELYNKYPKFNYSKSDFKYHLEAFLKTLKEEEKENIYKIFSNIEGNYGILNSLRLGKKISLSNYKDILLK